MEIAPIVLIVEPTDQTVVWNTDRQGRLDLSAIAQAINICPKLRVAIIQQIPQQFVEPVIAENVWNTASSFAFLRGFHGVGLVCDVVCGRCVAWCVA